MNLYLDAENQFLNENAISESECQHKPRKSLWIVIVSASYQYGKMKQACFGEQTPSLGLAFVYALALV